MQHGLKGTTYVNNGEPLNLNEWYLIVHTYKDNNFKVYVDGCKASISFDQTRAAVGKFVIGCRNYGNCATVTVDDLRYWSEEKDSHFIWWLWNY